MLTQKATYVVSREEGMIPIKIQIEAKNSNKLSISYSTKTAKVTKNSTVLLLV